MKSTLSIFIDESGSWKPIGIKLSDPKYVFSDNFYIIAFVFHKQNISISNFIERVNYLYDEYNITDRFIHFGPLLRGDDAFYKTFSKKDVKNIFYKFSSIIRHSDITWEWIVLDKRKIKSKQEFKEYFGSHIDDIFLNNYKYFNDSKHAIEYYDSGQSIINKLIVDYVETKFVTNDERFDIKPYDYVLCQVCDFICTNVLIRLKYEHDKSSDIEKEIFFKESDTRKKYRKEIISVLDEKRLSSINSF